MTAGRRDQRQAADRDDVIAALAGLPRDQWDGMREATRLRTVHGAAADRVLPILAEREAAARAEEAARWQAKIEARVDWYEREADKALTSMRRAWLLAVADDLRAVLDDA